MSRSIPRLICPPYSLQHLIEIGFQEINQKSIQIFEGDKVYTCTYGKYGHVSSVLGVI